MNEQKTVVIYHRADFDGIFCREIARKFLPDATLVGWDYSDPEPTIGGGILDGTERLYILDLSIPGLMNHPNLIWIDHHKSAIEKYPETIKGYRIDGVAACRLAWYWFANWNDGAGPKIKDLNGVPVRMATLKTFCDRFVIEPLAVRLAGEYDIWDKRDPNAELFQHGLRADELTDFDWKIFLDVDQSEMLVRTRLAMGRCVSYAKTQENAGIIQSYGFTLKWMGFTFLACNHARFNSFLFTAGYDKNIHNALLGFNWDGKNESWRVSMYHAPGHEDIDLSQIAVKFDGGGHRGACGFTCKELPFKL